MIFQFGHEGEGQESMARFDMCGSSFRPRQLKIFSIDRINFGILTAGHRIIESATFRKLNSFASLHDRPLEVILCVGFEIHAVVCLLLDFWVIRVIEFLEDSAQSRFVEGIEQGGHFHEFIGIPGGGFRIAFDFC